jgi:hypothetical protein
LDKDTEYYFKLISGGDVVGKGKRNKAKHLGQDSAVQRQAAELLTRNFQKEIRNSEIWPKMVA